MLLSNWHDWVHLLTLWPFSTYATATLYFNSFRWTNNHIIKTTHLRRSWINKWKLILHQSVIASCGCKGPLFGKSYIGQASSLRVISNIISIIIAAEVASVWKSAGENIVINIVFLKEVAKFKIEYLSFISAIHFSLLIRSTGTTVVGLRPKRCH